MDAAIVGDMPHPHFFIDVPTEGPRTNKIAGMCMAVDKESFVEWAQGLRWQLPPGETRYAAPEEMVLAKIGFFLHLSKRS